MKNGKKNGNGTNGTIKLEKGVPLPPAKDSSGLSDAMSAMEVGDSFVIERKRYGTVRTFASARRIAVRTRRIDETNMRVWRIQ